LHFDRVPICPSGRDFAAMETIFFLTAITQIQRCAQDGILATL
jgi:hypothetical protein